MILQYLEIIWVVKKERVVPCNRDARWIGERGSVTFNPPYFCCWFFPCAPGELQKEIDVNVSFQHRGDQICESAWIFIRRKQAEVSLRYTGQRVLRQRSKKGRE